MMNKKCHIRGRVFSPPLFSAPLAGITHSAFRRLVADFGGYGALWTEMLASRQILQENQRISPYLKRRPEEGAVIYQLMVCETDPLEEVLARLSELNPAGVDINLACHAPLIRQRDAGSRLFENADGLESVLQTARRCWPGQLTVKIRLGAERPDWQTTLLSRLQLFADSGVDAIVLHPRFFEDKFKRRARHEYLAWVKQHTRLPVIANGDLARPDDAQACAEADGLMMGRMLAAQPWLFAAWGKAPPVIDYAEVWLRLLGYIQEDFAPDYVISRIKLFTKYYAANFSFGHTLYRAVYAAPTVDAVKAAALRFFENAPALERHPSLLGL